MVGGANFSQFTESIGVIAKYKTAYYTAAHPIRLGLYAAEVFDEELHADVEKVALEIGAYFQVSINSTFEIKQLKIMRIIQWWGLYLINSKSAVTNNKKYESVGLVKRILLKI